MRNYILKLVLVFLATVSCLFTQLAFSQEAELEETEVTAAMDPKVLEAALREIYLERAREIIGRYVPADEYYLEASVQAADSQPEALPYSPSAVTSGSLKAMSADSVLEYSKSVTLTAFMSNRFNAKAKARIKAMLQSKLMLSTKRGDKFSFKALGIPVERAASAVERDLAKAEADLRQQKTEMEQKQAEAEKVKSELEQANAKLTDLGVTEESSFLDKAGMPLAVGFAALLGLAALAFAFMRAGSSVGGSVSGVARSLEMISGSLETSDDAGAASELAQPEEIKAIGGDVQGSGIALDTAYDRGMTLHKELVEALTPETEQVVLNHVNSQLSDSTSAGKAVCALEILGKDKANELFGKLSDEDQQEILRFMRTGTYDKPKAEVILEAGEELKSKIMAGAFRKVSADTSEQVSEKLLKLSDEDLIEVAGALHPDTLPRLFVYLEPYKIANILSGIMKNDENKFADSVTSIPRLPSATAAKQLDSELIPVLDQQIDKSKEDVQRAYLTFYQDIIESADETLAEHILNGLSATDERINTHLQENVITFATLFRIANDVREEVVTGMSNRDLAAILYNLEEDQATLIKEVIAERRMEIVAEESERVEGLGARKIKVAKQHAKSIVINRIKQVKGDSSLEEIMASQEELTENQEQLPGADSFEAA